MLLAEAETKDSAGMSRDSIIIQFPQSHPFGKHEQALIANVQSSDWTNPQPSGCYNRV